MFPGIRVFFTMWLKGALQGKGFFVFVIVIMIVSPTGDFYFLVSHFWISPSLVLFL